MILILRRTAVLLLTATLIFAAVGAGTVGTLWHLSLETPDFYKQAAVSAKNADPAKGKSLEKSILELPAGQKQESQWEIELTVEEINSWLAYQLPERFPNLLPTGCKEPLAAIQGEDLLVACKYQTSSFNSVVWLKVAAEMTEEQNVVAFHIKEAKAGLVPLPVSQWLEEGTTRARRSGVNVELKEVEGDVSLILVKIPSEDKDYLARRVFVDTISVHDQAITVRGRFLPSETLIGSNVRVVR